jgi:hypothetical protein
VRNQYAEYVMPISADSMVGRRMFAGAGRTVYMPASVNRLSCPLHRSLTLPYTTSTLLYAADSCNSVTHSFVPACSVQCGHVR